MLPLLRLRQRSLLGVEKQSLDFATVRIEDVD